MFATIIGVIDSEVNSNADHKPEMIVFHSANNMEGVRMAAKVSGQAVPLGKANGQHEIQPATVLIERHFNWTAPIQAIPLETLLPCSTSFIYLMAHLHIIRYLRPISVQNLEAGNHYFSSIIFLSSTTLSTPTPTPEFERISRVL